jgi:ADP-ribosylglycohydrolase
MNKTINKHMDKQKPESDINLKTKFRAIMLLHALGDTIGFKNGDWEFNYNDSSKYEVLEYVNELIYEFIALGGVNGINLENWKVSDDTFFHIAIAKSLLKYNKNDGIDEVLLLDIKRNLICENETMRMEYLPKINDTMKKQMKEYYDVDTDLYYDSDGKKIIFRRYAGIATVNSIENYSKTHDARHEKYNPRSGGNGCAMRTLCIGMCFYGKDNRDTLIDASIISSQITHNNALGYLAGFNAALFTALALENVPINKWPYILIKYLNSNKLKSFLSLDNLDQVYDHYQYIRFWQKYIDTKFDKDCNPLKLL